jgi:hypothetical protein
MLGRGDESLLHLPHPGEIEGDEMIVCLLDVQVVRMMVEMVGLVGLVMLEGELAGVARGPGPRRLLPVVRPGPVKPRLGLPPRDRFRPQGLRGRRRRPVTFAVGAADLAAVLLGPAMPAAFRQGSLEVVMVRVRGGDVALLLVVGDLRVGASGVLVSWSLALALAGRLATFAEALGEGIVVDLQLRYVLVLESCKGHSLLALSASRLQ